MQYKFSKHDRNRTVCTYKYRFQQYFSNSMNVSFVGGGVSRVHLATCMNRTCSFRGQITKPLLEITQIPINTWYYIVYIKLCGQFCVMIVTGPCGDRRCLHISSPTTI